MDENENAHNKAKEENDKVNLDDAVFDEKAIKMQIRQ
jgi:hypothetical protein